MKGKPGPVFENMSLLEHMYPTFSLLKKKNLNLQNLIHEEMPITKPSSNEGLF